jgi:hypothetical protein
VEAVLVRERRREKPGSRNDGISEEPLSERSAGEQPAEQNGGERTEAGASS